MIANGRKKKNLSYWNFGHYNVDFLEKGVKSELVLNYFAICYSSIFFKYTQDKSVVYGTNEMQKRKFNYSDY